MKRRPSLKAEWKNDAHALDVADAPERARAVFTAIWAHTDTDAVNGGRVSMTWPKVSTLRSQTGIPNDKAVMRALDWLAENGFIWRVSPKKNGRCTVGVRGGGTLTLDRGVGVYAYIARASAYERVRWAHSARQQFGAGLDGGPTLATALAVNLAAIDREVTATRARVFNEAVDAVTSRRVRVSGLAAFVDRALDAAVNCAPPGSALSGALRRLNAAQIATEVEDATADPERASQTTAKVSA